MIKDTLEAISKLNYPDYEVVVVDNSAGEEKEKTAAVSQNFGVKYVYEPRRGLNVARNVGASQASGEVIAFTDDDCLPEPDWILHTMQNFSDPTVWACTARIVQHSRDGAADLFEEVAGQDLGATKRVFTSDDVRFGLGFFLGNLSKVTSKHMKSRAPAPFGIGHGSGMAFRKEVFQSIGLFDERFGSGAKLGGCDDIEMLYRVLKAGHSIVYEPAAVVRHKHRFSAEDVFHTRFDYSCSGAIFMWHYRWDPLMFVMFFGRLTQLVIKTAQYRLLRKRDLARSFSSDLQGFLKGWADHRRFFKENPDSKRPASR